LDVKRAGLKCPKLDFGFHQCPADTTITEMAERGPILTLSYLLSYRVFSNMDENRMNIDDSTIDVSSTPSTLLHK
jgi:hypothetical protein